MGILTRKFGSFQIQCIDLRWKPEWELRLFLYICNDTVNSGLNPKNFIMRKVQAVFSCNTVIPAEYGYDTVAHLSAICDEKGLYKSYSEATPSGQISIQVSKDVPAHKFFKSGRTYKVDFTLVPLTEEEREWYKKNNIEIEE